MRNIFCDLHIHIGSALNKPVKITASRKLTLEQVLFHDAVQKGLDVVGIVDSASPLVIKEIEIMLEKGLLIPLHDGGLRARNGIVLLLGAELETREGIHVITYLPDLDMLKKYQNYIKSRVTNVNLSTQRASASIKEILNLSYLCEGVFCFAHAFTPHKGVYGLLTDKLLKILGHDLTQIKVIELGLSADSDLADMLEETRNFTYLSNSDAHSSANIAREYNLLKVAGLNFKEIKLALHNEAGRKVVANYGLDPLMGKYHRSYCLECEKIMAGVPPVFTCPNCQNNTKMVAGVFDRIVEIRDYSVPHHPLNRPAYNYRVPLKDIPGVGPKTLAKLHQNFTSEIEVLELASIDEISQIVGINIANMINKMRTTRLDIIPGGGGYYGKVAKYNSN